MISTIVEPYLSELCYLCYKLGVFPSNLEYAKIVPLHKSGPTYLPTNYRPIFILSPFAKIFEQLIHEKLHTFFTKNNIISSQQNGFRKNHSTSLAVLDLLSVLQQNKDKGKIGCCINYSLT